MIMNKPGISHGIEERIAENVGLWNQDKELASLVRPLLEKLGETPREIADNLFKQGCLGVRRCIGNCPLAEYLKKHGCSCAVFSSEVWAVPTTKGPIYSCCLTPAAAKFVFAFDAGKYPELVKDLSDDVEEF